MAAGVVVRGLGFDGVGELVLGLGGVRGGGDPGEVDGVRVRVGVVVGVGGGVVGVGVGGGGVGAEAAWVGGG